MMTRFGSLLFCSVLGLGAALVSCGGGSDGPTGGSGGGGGAGGGGGVGGTEAVLAVVPVDNTIAGWTVDPTIKLTAGQAAAIALDFKKAEEYIDGGANPFYTTTFAPDVFAWQNYMNPTATADGYTLSLYVMKMPSAAQATAIYESLLDGTKAFYSSNKWADPSPAIGDKARITNSGADWWINFRKGAFYSEVRLTYAEATDLVGKQQAIDFATAVASKI
jgi:hypothetical protein